MSAWDEQRPIFKRLPQYGWQDNEIADAVTSAYDQILMELKEAIDNFPRDFIDPDTCRADALDWLAQLMGYTGEYWDSVWAEPIKRQLIKDAQQKVWQYKGTLFLLTYLLDLFGFENVQIRIQGGFIIGTNKIGDPIGGNPMIYSIAIGTVDDIGYLRSSDEWRLIERLNRLFMPCWCAPIPSNGNFLHYNKFKIGFSVIGDPL